MRGSSVAGFYRVVVALVAALGVVLNVHQHGAGDSLVFFTVQSNILLAAAFAWSAWASFARRAPLPGWLKGAATLYIVITGLVFNFVLADAPSDTMEGGDVAPTAAMELSTWLLHTAVPVLAVLDWLLFDEHRRLRWRCGLLWLAYPVCYFVFALVRGALIDAEVRYPYPFINVDMLGAAGVAQNVVLYGAAFWLLGALLVALDRFLPRNAAPPRAEEPSVPARTGS
ncbi:hypothetical protein GCM10027174_29870 [Salinifilum aidingensis]